MHDAHQQRRRTVTLQAEGADEELVLAAGDPERRLVPVLLPDAELQIGHHDREVQLREEARAPRLVDELRSESRLIDVLC